MNKYLVYVKFTNGIELASGEIETDELILNFEADTAQGALDNLNEWANSGEESLEIVNYYIQAVR